ncbi:Histidine kinase [Rhodovastum atsumiense]|uniref:histidine kinase n=1 Tax=Rhodovastum atsumiense TaxID=504468 RepID=A0A5M6IVK7_9PROT|nr:ATP-binding protein [Rhodovastum atsumiense]KAA5612312.1 HAMP domain-containing protein [Rhodovastum atsumiense]CAH2601641.1 Histidine kinase [Rhodovastum atsumiense]
MRLPGWPRSLATRTALVLVSGLVLVQVAGLTIHALDLRDVQHLAQARDAAVRIMSIYRGVMLAPPEQRPGLVAEFDSPSDISVTVSDRPVHAPLPPMPPPVMRQMRAALLIVPVPAQLRPRDTVMQGSPEDGRMAIGMRMPEQGWLNVVIQMPASWPWDSQNFLIAFLLMTIAAAGLTLWAVRRLTAPVGTLAAAADALGRDVNAPPLPETGPTEIATAARAFNTMADRIRRFVQDRTFMLSAIGHDLRTPITRLKLRAEFLEDDELRGKLLADLDELEAMVSATLAFGRDVAADEPVTAVDLPELARTVLDETADARPEAADCLSYDGPDHLTVRVRSIAMKRALTNLVQNAMAYGGSAHLRLRGPEAGQVLLTVEDDGPGIPPGELDLVFQPFHRVEVSRNRETGGTGLGLPIARNILRAHGGDVTLANRREGGIRATVTIPV